MEKGVRDFGIVEILKATENTTCSVFQSSSDFPQNLARDLEFEYFENLVWILRFKYVNTYVGLTRDRGL